MLHVRVNAWHGKCPRHPGYSPKDGDAAIKAGCPYCFGLWKIYAAELALTCAIDRFQQLELDAGAARGELLDFRAPQRSHLQDDITARPKNPDTPAERRAAARLIRDRR